MGDMQGGAWDNRKSQTGGGICIYIYKEMSVIMECNMYIYIYMNMAPIETHRIKGKNPHTLYTSIAQEGFGRSIEIYMQANLEVHAFDRSFPVISENGGSHRINAWFMQVRMGT